MGVIVPHTNQLQINGYYCGPAATREALSARNLFPSQDELAGKLGTTTAGTNSSDDVVRVLNSYLGPGVYSATRIPGSDATPAERDELRRDVKQSLDAGYAIVANVVGTIHTNDGSSYTYSGGHYVAIVGYDDSDNVLVGDIAVREYWATLAAMATWIAERGYSSSTVTAPAPPAPGTPPPWPAYMPAGHYYGLMSSPLLASHGGTFVIDRAPITLLQKRLQELGYAPGGSGWADGLFEQATFDAVAKFQHDRLAATTTRPGEVWPDDWAALFGPVPVTPPPPPPTPEPPPVVTGDTILVVDLASPYQDGADLAAFKAAGVVAVNIKTTQGMTYTNPRAVQWGAEARANGLQMSTFHWLDNSGSGVDQARRAFAVMQQIGGGTVDGMAHACDCEDNAPQQTIVDYLIEMARLLGGPVAFYTGDWWLDDPSRRWNIRATTPYLWAAPNDGYRSAYPGDDSPDWHAGYGGYDTLSALQFAVQPISGGGGNVSKTMMRKGVWSALTTRPTPPTPTPEPPPAGCDPDAIAAAVVAALTPHLLTEQQAEDAAFRGSQRAEDS